MGVKRGVLPAGSRSTSSASTSAAEAIIPPCPVNPAVLRGLIQDWLDQGNTHRILSVRSGIPLPLIQQIANRASVVDPQIAARILVVLKEPLRPELARAFAAWENQT